jgi:hypothetical protein
VFRCGSPGSSRPWRGFPIRTPWDHSPVIDSPRLIADSYVLLRLLMPRHPPCALKNLTTKDQGVISREPQKPTTPPTPHKRSINSAARSRFIFLEIASYKRCSRPLCSSQTTTPNHTPHTQTRMIDAARKTRNTSPDSHSTTPQPPVLLLQDPTVCQTRNQPRPTPPFQDHPPQTRETIRTKPGKTQPAAIR